ncbi:MAG: GDSL-type esterase/lipase family protein [Acidimicrobiia bacterium]
MLERGLSTTGLVRRLLKRGVVGFTVLTGQVMHAAHRRDLPSFQNQDPSADLGNPANPRLRIVLMGDSSMTAPGVYPLDLCWPRRLAHDLTDRYFVELRSVAIGGSKAADILRDQIEAALAFEPHMVLISVGANDALRAVPVASYERDLGEIVRRLSADVEAIGLSGIGDLGSLPRLPEIPRAWARVRGRSFNRALQRVAHRYGAPKSETWGPIWRPFSEGDLRVFADDRFHASAEGHAIFAMAMRPVVEALVEKLEPLLSAQRGSRESST